MSDKNNELRCYANEIILTLHKLKEVGQIQLLYMACSLALKDLDRAAYRETIENAMATLNHGNPKHRTEEK